MIPLYARILAPAVVILAAMAVGGVL